MERRRKVDLLALPEEVRRRFAELPAAQLAAVRSNGIWAGGRFESRANSDGSMAVHGYASVYGVAYQVYGGPPYGWDETMESGAFDRVVRENQDVRLLINHEGLPLARTAAGTLTIASDSNGLLMDAPALDSRNPRVAELCSCLDRRDADQMSIGFVIGSTGRQSWNEDYTKRSIYDVESLDDVSVVTYPASLTTIVALRSLVARESARQGRSFRLAEAEIESLR